MASTQNHTQVRVQGGVQEIVDLALAARNAHMTLAYKDTGASIHDVQPESVTLLSVTQIGNLSRSVVLVVSLALDESPEETLIVHAHSVIDEFYPQSQGGRVKSYKWALIGVTGEFDLSTTTYHDGDSVVKP